MKFRGTPPPRLNAALAFYISWLSLLIVLVWVGYARGRNGLAVSALLTVLLGLALSLLIVGRWKAHADSVILSPEGITVQKWLGREVYPWASIRSIRSEDRRASGGLTEWLRPDRVLRGSGRAVELELKRPFRWGFIHSVHGPDEKGLSFGQTRRTVWVETPDQFVVAAQRFLQST